jgi:hypothetical protein
MITFQKFLRLLAAAAVWGAMLLTPLTARADLIDTVLGIVAPEYAEAKTIIQCIVNKGSFNESVAKTCIEEQAKAQSKKLVASDPKLKSIVDIVFAAKAEEWVQVLELVHTDGLHTVVCSSVSVGGAVKDLVCGSVFQIAKPVIKSALQAVMKGDWWVLVTLLGPTAACGVIPGGEIKDAICGPLGQALNELGKFAKGGVKAGKDALISFGETVSGQTQHIPPEEYYQDYWHYPYAALDAMIVLRGWGKPSHKVEYDHCVGYFDSHKASKGSAEKWCGHMRDQLAALVDAVVKAANAAPAPYFAAKVKPQIPGFALDYYYGIEGGKFTGPQLAGACASDISKFIPIPGSAKYPTEKDLGPPPYTPAGWACNQVWPMLNQEITAYKQQAMPALIGKLAAAGCPTQKQFSGNPMLYFLCDTWDEGMKKCESLTTHDGAAKGHDHCQVDYNKATPKLTKKIASELGAKRCKALTVGKNYVVCSRPWKKKMCEALVEKYQGKVGTWNAQVTCEEGPKEAVIAFAVMTKQAHDILGTLNGVKKVGGVQKKPGGEIEGLVLVPPVKVCNNDGFDPLSITCGGNPKAPAQAGVKLAACAPDPNNDGADAPCYAGPLDKESVNVNMVGAPVLTLPVVKSSPGSGQATNKPQIEINQTPPAITSKPSHIDGTVKRTPSNALPDITSSAQIMIGSVSTQWGATVNVDDKQAFSAQNGVCQFTVQHTTRNIGLASTGAFDSIWTNSNAHGSWSRVWGSIASGGQGTQKDMVMLKPGMNILNLKLDNPLKVQESNENNNQFRVIVNLSGACGAASRIAPPSADRLKTPANPRLPVTPERASDPVLRR